MIRVYLSKTHQSVLELLNNMRGKNARSLAPGKVHRAKPFCCQAIEFSNPLSKFIVQ